MEQRVGSAADGKVLVSSGKHPMFEKPVDLKMIEAQPEKHVHPSETDDRQFRAAQSLVDQNLYEFTRWLKYRLKGEPDIKNSERLLLKGFFTYMRKALHRAVCAQTWHMILKIMEEVANLVNDDPEAVKRMAERLAAPDMKARIQQNLAVDKEDLEEITSKQIAKAFKKMFGKKITREVLAEFLEQAKFIRDNLYRMGFP